VRRRGEVRRPILTGLGVVVVVITLDRKSSALYCPDIST